MQKKGEARYLPFILSKLFSVLPESFSLPLSIHKPSESLLRCTPFRLEEEHLSLRLILVRESSFSLNDLLCLFSFFDPKNRTTDLLGHWRNPPWNRISSYFNDTTNNFFKSNSKGGLSLAHAKSIPSSRGFVPSVFRSRSSLFLCSYLVTYDYVVADFWNV